MDGFLFVEFVLIAGLIALNGVLLFQLKKKEDSKKGFIKTKSMGETLGLTCMFLAMESFISIFDLRENNDEYLNDYPMELLFLISFFFLITLLRNKYKYGGKSKKKRKRNR